LPLQDRKQNQFNQKLNFLRIALKMCLQSILYWMFFYPLNCIVPKQKNRVLFWGRSPGFSDNAKYLFLYFSNKESSEFDSWFVTKDRRIYQNLKQHGVKVIFFDSMLDFRALWEILRAKIAVFDRSAGTNYPVANQFTIQLWHGIGLKQCGLNSPHYQKRMKHWIYRLLYGFTQMFPRYDLMLSTSPYFTKNFFANIAQQKEVLEAGYPRNDVFYRKPSALDNIGIDHAVAQKIELQAASKKIVLYAPTFRLSGANAFNQKILNLEQLNQFCSDCAIYFVIKMHGIEQSDLDCGGNYTNIVWSSQSSDIYPLLSKVDLLITDYSSIYFDFLLLDRPILYFNWDFEEYIKADVGMTDQYENLTPGKKCLDQMELEYQLRSVLVEGKDHYKEARARVSALAFGGGQGLSSERIYARIEKLHSQRK